MVVLSDSDFFTTQNSLVIPTFSGCKTDLSYHFFKKLKKLSIDDYGSGFDVFRTIGICSVDDAIKAHPNKHQVELGRCTNVPEHPDHLCSFDAKKSQVIGQEVIDHSY